MKEYAEDARLLFVSHLSKLHIMSRDFQRDHPLDLLLVFDELPSFFTKETLQRFVDIGEQ